MLGSGHDISTYHSQDFVYLEFVGNYAEENREGLLGGSYDGYDSRWQVCLSLEIDEDEGLCVNVQKSMHLCIP